MWKMSRFNAVWDSVSYNIHVIGVSEEDEGENGTEKKKKKPELNPRGSANIVTREA